MHALCICVKNDIYVAWSLLVIPFCRIAGCLQQNTELKESMPMLPADQLLEAI